MKRWTHISSILVALLVCQDIFADEGMWMIQDIHRALEAKMQERGLKLSAHEIYNAEAEGACLSDAIVSLDFECTGSLISDQGLVITNHHCAYSDVHALSTPERNYLEDGFWARDFLDEQPIPGKHAYILKRVVDVTDEVREVVQDPANKGKVVTMRKISFILEKKWSRETGLEASLSSMWRGSKYYMSLYEVYSDIRLVSAPPVTMSAFGGDIDNWEWPQQKCDFAMYRIYTAPDGSPAKYAEENVPMNSLTHLAISTQGYQAGDFTMVLGYPGSTNRFSSGAETDDEIDRKLPISNELRGRQMEIINGWMNQDEGIRLKYSDYYFMLSNVQELQDGEVECCKRFKVQEIKHRTDEELQEWIHENPERVGRWGELLPLLQKKYEDLDEIERNISYYRESLIRGIRFNSVIFRINSLRDAVIRANGVRPKRLVELVDGKPDPAEEAICQSYRFYGKEFPELINWALREYEEMDMQVEKDLFFYAMKEFYAHVDARFWGDYQTQLFHEFTEDGVFNVQALSEWMWEQSYISEQSRFEQFIAQEHTYAEYDADPLFKFYMDIMMYDFSTEKRSKEGDLRISDLTKEYTRALYQMRLDKGELCYPDANSTMRITYGTVGGLEPRDAVINHWQTTTSGILEKYNPHQYEYRLSERQQDLYRTGDWGRWGVVQKEELPYAGAVPAGSLYMPVNFMTDNDITGGNSGSPVLNAEGQLIGLAFDGNKESLASDLYCVPAYNKCICVDIRYVLWTLDRYAHMDRILKEIGF